MVADLEVNAVLFDPLIVRGWEVHLVPDDSAALSLVADGECGLIVSSADTAANDDLAAHRKIRSLCPKIPMIVLLRDPARGETIAALRAHAFRCFSKPRSLEARSDMLRVALEHLDHTSTEMECSEPCPTTDH